MTLEERCAVMIKSDLKYGCVKMYLGMELLFARLLFIVQRECELKFMYM